MKIYMEDLFLFLQHFLMSTSLIYGFMCFSHNQENFQLLFIWNHILTALTPLESN
jgi:hypothetical protein